MVERLVGWGGVLVVFIESAGRGYWGDVAGDRGGSDLVSDRTAEDSAARGADWAGFAAGAGADPAGAAIGILRRDDGCAAAKSDYPPAASDAARVWEDAEFSSD